MCLKVACYQSHRKAWRQILENQWQQAMVLEDDADLDLAKSKDLILNFLADVPSDWDLLYLGIINTEV